MRAHNNNRNQLPVTPANVNSEIWRFMRRCDEVITEIYKAGDEYAVSRVEFDDRHAREILNQQEGTVQEKKAQADINCKDEYKRFLSAEIRYKYLKTILDTTREQLSACQSIGANLREEWQINKQYKP